MAGQPPEPDLLDLPGSVPREPSIRLFAIPDLLSRFLVRPPGPDYAVKPAGHFGPGDFLIPFLSPEELDRLNGFKVMKKQVEWSCGRFGAKTLIRERLMPKTGLADITIRYRELGAPYVTDFPGLCLSLSHSRDLIAAALGLTPDLAFGIDIEAIGPMPDQAFMKIAFTSREREAMAPDAVAVFRNWTLKEAYLKYIQKGFNESLREVEVIEDHIYHGGEQQPVLCRSWILPRGFALGLVTNRP